MPILEQPTAPRNERRAMPRHLRDGEHDSEQMALAGGEDPASSRSGTWLLWVSLVALGGAAVWWWS